MRLVRYDGAIGWRFSNSPDGRFATPDPLGVFSVAEVFFVSRFCQPGLLARSFPSLLAVHLQTEALTFSMTVIRKKMSLAVQALAVALLSLHRFKSQTNQSQKNQSKEGRKSRRKKTQNGEEGRRLFSESFEENTDEEDPFLNRPLCGNSTSPLAAFDCLFGFQ